MENSNPFTNLTGLELTPVMIGTINIVRLLAYHKAPIVMVKMFFLEQIKDFEPFTALTLAQLFDDMHKAQLVPFTKEEAEAMPAKYKDVVQELLCPYASRD